MSESAKCPGSGIGSGSGSSGLVIITGIGRNVLKPSVADFLAELAPPLAALEPPDNPGRLVVPGRRLWDWTAAGGRA